MLYVIAEVPLSPIGSAAGEAGVMRAIQIPKDELVRARVHPSLLEKGSGEGCRPSGLLRCRSNDFEQPLCDQLVDQAQQVLPQPCRIDVVLRFHLPGDERQTSVLSD